MQYNSRMARSLYNTHKVLVLSSDDYSCSDLISIYEDFDCETNKS